MTTQERKVMELALEALERSVATCFDQYAHEQVMSRPEHFVNQAITAIKEALAQTQEPVAWEQFYPDFGKPQIAINPETVGYVAPQPKKQEPVAWMSPHIKDRDGDWVYDFSMYRDDYYMFPVYAAPPERTWVGLTKEEIAEFDTWHDNREEEVGWCNPSEIVAYIEAKLKQKNGYAEEKNT
jgi:hypothetical protein